MISVLERFFSALVFKSLVYVQNMKRYSVTSSFFFLFPEVSSLIF